MKRVKLFIQAVLVGVTLTIVLSNLAKQDMSSVQEPLSVTSNSKA